MFLEISESLFLEGQHMETFDMQMSNTVNWAVWECTSQKLVLRCSSLHNQISIY